MARGYSGSTTNEVYRDRTRTPQWLFEALNAEFKFCLDAAALPETALCERYLTPQIDALSVSWGDFVPPFERAPFVWVNPPYSNPVPWIKKCLEEKERGIGSVVLIPEDSSAEWWPGDDCSEVRRITGYTDANGKWRSGRINFINAETGEEIKGNNKGSNLLVFIPGYNGPCLTRHVSKGDLLVKGMAMLGDKAGI